MKKLLAFLVTMVMGLCLLTGCGDPVADEFEKYLNTDMVEVNTKYIELKTEFANWANYTTDEEILDSIQNKILPNIDEQFTMLGKIELTTDEVKAVKAKYEVVLNKYKDGYTQMLSAFEAVDEAGLEASLTLIQDALTALEEYNAALEALAEEKGMTVQYAE